MNDSTDCADVDRAMQDAPAAAAKAANPASRGRNRERNEQREREEAYGDEGALVDIFPDFVDVEKFVEPEVRGEMQAGVEEGEEAEHAAEADQLGQVKELAQRSDGEGDHEKSQGPVSGTVLDELKWIRDYVAAQERHDDGGQGTEAAEEQNGFGPFAGEEFGGERGGHAAIPLPRARPRGSRALRRPVVA